VNYIQGWPRRLSVFAQFERQLIIERVHSGMNHAKKGEQKPSILRSPGEPLIEVARESVAIRL